MAGRIAYYGNIVKDGLVLCLDAAKKDSYPGSGTVWRDISGFGNNGTLTNGPTFNSANYGSIVFDGVNDYCSLGTSLLLTNQVSYNSWIKTSNILGHLIGAYNNVSPFPGWAVGVGFNNSGRLEWWSGNGWKSSTIICNTNVWIHVGVVFDGTSVFFYSNGVFNTSTTSATIAEYTGNKFLGARANDGQTPFSGQMNQIQIYNRALSSTEILQNYNATKGRYGL